MLQLDISVKDKRSPNGWFFGTFMYDAGQPGDTPYQRLVPVGLIWGSDPDLTSSTYLDKGFVARESWVNPVVAEHFFPLPRHNLGLFGRANGPVDNPQSACITCHQRSLDWGTVVLPKSKRETEALQLLPDVPSDPFNATATQAYFRNIGSASPVPNTQSLDYTLQVSKGIASFRTWVFVNYPDHASSTTDVTPYPFQSGPLELEPASSLQEVGADAFDGPPPDMDSGLFVR
jgi:hypothetical protein